ncbi:uncharacterized protein LOC102794097 [Neolamprologus brichardi]|uniref:uncharacterized protein LOC102794097 n=1 Tax=Neolamprologus brichardi TaxID=32507 RepID=UPI0003EBF42A|nr:uncharacterized protein LOC102794097 [Neolamprologus brichardi]
MEKHLFLSHKNNMAIHTNAKKSPPLFHNKENHIFKHKQKKPTAFTKIKPQISSRFNYLHKGDCNFRRVIFKNWCEKSIQVHTVSKTKSNNLLKRKYAFSNVFPVPKKSKRNRVNIKFSEILFSSKILSIPGNQIFFLSEVKSFNTHIFSEILTAAEVKQLNTCRIEEQKEMKLKDECKPIHRQNNKDEKFYHLIIDEMQKKISSVDPNRFFPFLKEYLQSNEQKQYAFAIVVMKHSKNIIVSPAFQPDYEKRENPGKIKHSEPRLCEAFEPFLQQNGNLVETILIYTFNSPCLGCSCLLLGKAYLWRYKYGFSTTVAFTQFYKQNCFQTPTCSSTNMLSPCGVFYEDSQRWKRDHFKLKSFTVNTEIFQNIRKLSEKEEKESCRKKIESYVSELKTLAKNSFCSRETHLQRGENTIYSFVFPPMIQNACRDSLLRDWSALVNDSAMSMICCSQNTPKVFEITVAKIREKMAMNCTNPTVDLIYQNHISSCETNSPLNLYHLQNKP